MRLSSDLIFLWGQRGIPNSLHFLLRTVSPTFRFLDASTIGISKYLTKSDKAIFAMWSLGALFFFTTKPATLHLINEMINSTMGSFTNGTENLCTAGQAEIIWQHIYCTTIYSIHNCIQLRMRNTRYKIGVINMNPVKEGNIKSFKTLKKKKIHICVSHQIGFLHLICEVFKSSTYRTTD